MKRKILFLITFCSIILSEAFGTGVIHMKISGYNGSSTDANFNNYFDIEETSLTNTGCSSSSCTVTPGNFIFKWIMDNASIPLKIKMFQASSATNIPSVDIVYTSPSSGSTYRVFYQVHLTNVRVTNISQVADTSINLKEQVSLTYQTISWKYTYYNADGSAGAIVRCNDVADTGSCPVVFPF